uniref:DegT/DnrJ/EryC1/StrS aminotransferase n=1 Tax=Cyanothece sp. (strain PCC 7425 / ATCC 29141) TaxID=395961 RepID=B8HXG4_CYAP4
MSFSPIPILDLRSQYQRLQTEIQAAITQVLESGHFILGPEVQAFEAEAAAYLGVKHAIGVNSGTDALIIGLRALGIGMGDEVITTPFSFFATAESISNVGATPVFVDVEQRSFNLNPAAIRAKITPRTRAILPVHLFGNPAAMGQILDIAQEYQLKVIEDCAQSFGARYFGNCTGCEGDCKPSTLAALQGRFTGGLGHLGAFSFFPSKNLGAYGDGGLIVTDDDQIADLAQQLRVHGAKHRYHNELLGYNSRLDALQAAILRVKLPYIDTWNAARRQVARYYNQRLADLPELITPEITDGHVFHQYTIRVMNQQRDRLKTALENAGISTMIYYPVPQDRLPVYAGKYPANPVSDELSTQVLSLPIWPELELAQIEFITDKIRQALRY